jgi:hypothetical protein
MKTCADLKRELGIPDFHVDEVSPALVAKTRVSHCLTGDRKVPIGPRKTAIRPPAEDLSHLNTKAWHEQQRRKNKQTNNG